MPSTGREGFTVRILRTGTSVPAGVGFVVDDRHIITCAHVVNAALNRDQRLQDMPGPEVRIQVDFPMLGDAAGAPSRTCAVQAWSPPPRYGIFSGDVAGLVLIGDSLPTGAGASRMTDAATLRGAAVNVFGYPGDPPRQANGAWSELRLRGAVGGDVLQLDAASESAIRAQPGYSGSPVVVGDEAETSVLGMLAVASRDNERKDVYAIPISRLVDAWPDILGPLTIPVCPYRGLASFTAEDDRTLFVGRDMEVDQLWKMVGKQPLVIITGPSGVGKSSLVNAGLIPLLREQAWATASFPPGRNAG